MKKLFFILICTVIALSGCSNTANKAQANETSDPSPLTPIITSTPEQTVLSPTITPIPTQSPAEQSIAPTPTPTVKATPTPTPATTSAKYTEYKKLAVSSYFTARQLVGVDAVSEAVENTTKDPTMFKLTVDVTNKVVKVYKKSGDTYVLYRLMICTVGQSGYSTPKGTFSLTGYHVRFGYFSKYNCYAQYWSQINGQILFHSILFSRQENSAYRVTSYNNLGKAASHGCVRLSVPDAKWVYENCPKGTQVTIGAYAKDTDLVKAVQLPKLK